MRSVDEEYVWFFSGEYPALVRTLFFIVHNRERAEDIAQEAFMQLLIHWKKVSAYQRPDAWVRRVAIRLAMRSIRREQMRSFVERGSHAAELPQPVDVDLAKAIRTASSTTEERRGALLLRGPTHARDRGHLGVLDFDRVGSPPQGPQEACGSARGGGE